MLQRGLHMAIHICGGGKKKNWVLFMNYFIHFIYFDYFNYFNYLIIWQRQYPFWERFKGGRWAGPAEVVGGISYRRGRAREHRVAGELSVLDPKWAV